MRYGLIMAGGSGTRLWPMSRADEPKQLIKFLKGRSLLEVAADRLEGLIEPEQRLICTAERFRKSIRSAMPLFADEQIFGEPTGRDTLAAVGFPAAVLAGCDPEAAIAVFTADHLIEPQDDFRQCIDTGFRIVEQNPQTLVTFGIRPTHAATGYGYVELGEPLAGFEGARSTETFREKPDAQTAEQYVQSGNYLWNSGMFVWRASTLLDCIRRYEPSVHAGLMRIAEAWNTPKRREVLEEVFPTLKKISVDYGVMEPASKDEAVDLATVAMEVQWLDVGGWPAYAQTLEADAQGNRTDGSKTMMLDSQNVTVVNSDPDHLIATVGLEDLIVVHTPHATLLCRPEAAEKIKQLHGQVAETFGDDYV
ncbi:MAG: mannose-1-phosphate guanylyltransferase [Phycisphaeraceae bacterium]|nr:mannose-1-phosphate guanylyltransferase [Phycisphaeraceae bacterium]